MKFIPLSLLVLLAACGSSESPAANGAVVGETPAQELERLQAERLARIRCGADVERLPDRPARAAEDFRCLPARPVPGEAPAEALPTDEEIALAIDNGDGIRDGTVEVNGVSIHVQGDGMRDVVRNSKCEWLHGGRSRVRCTFEAERVPFDLSHTEGVRRVREHHWQPAVVRLLVYTRSRGERGGSWDQLF